MKIKYLILFLSALVFTLGSCDSPLGVEDNVRKINDQQYSYFPMQVGNQWVYDNFVGADTMTVTIKIQDIKTIDGKQYYVFSNPLDSGKSNSFDNSIYLRLEDNNRIVRYDNNKANVYDRNSTYIDFEKSKDDNVSYGYVCIEKLTVELSWKTFDNCIGVTYGGTNPDIEYYAPGVGLVWRSGLNGRMLLKSAVINGKILQ